MTSPLDPVEILYGAVVGFHGRAEIENVLVTLVATTTNGDVLKEQVRTDADGKFEMKLPSQRLLLAGVSADIDGYVAVDLEPNGERLTTGDVVLFFEDQAPSFMRYAG